MSTTPQPRRYEERLAHERRHFNRIARRQWAAPLVMSSSNIERYRRPPANTPYPLEYAFHLAGDLRGRCVLEIGSGDGLNTVILAALGAKVTAIDVSDECLRLSRERAQINGVEDKTHFVNSDAAKLDLPDASSELVFAISVLHHVDIASAAREIRRVLKPGGRAVFMEPPLGHPVWQAMKRLMPKPPDVSDDERPLTPQEIRLVTETVGILGQARYFGLTYRLMKRLNCGNRRIIHRCHTLDAWLLKRIRFLSGFASPFVWCADKPA